jgi:hypothetical protein
VNPWITRTALGTAATVPLLAGSAVPAIASTPAGTCTSSYTLSSYDDLYFDPAAQAIFSVIDANGDGFICFKPYPNGEHHGHAGNLVDDKAAPHV